MAFPSALWFFVALTTVFSSLAQQYTTETTRLFGTYNVNSQQPSDTRNPTYNNYNTDTRRLEGRNYYSSSSSNNSPYTYNADGVLISNLNLEADRRGASASASSSSSTAGKKPGDTIYWEKNFDIQTSRDRPFERERLTGSASGSQPHDRYSDRTYPERSPFDTFSSASSSTYNRGNYDSARAGYDPNANSRSSANLDRDRGSNSDWNRNLEQERQRQGEYNRERNYYANSRPLPNYNSYNNNPSHTYPGQNIPRVKLPTCGIWDEWRSDLMGMCRPDYANSIQDKDVFVTTPYGRIRGFYVYLFDGPGVPLGDRPGVYHNGKLWRNVSAFLGVPYAQPPINEGRFRPPRPKRAWSLWDATDFGPACPQPVQFIGASKGIRTMNEDCLYLNIYTPTTGAVPERYPVIFYIHGGEFERGASNTFPGHMLAAFGQVVVVTVNYRLGALGFLSTADEYSPGNYGMLDLQLALQWVYDNIYVFNGNKDLITVYGTGSGAGAAGLLAITPKTKNMVRQVIAQSGSPLADWAALRDHFRAQNTSRVYGERMGCIIDNSYKLVDCLSSRSFEELGNVRVTPDVGTWAWSPIVDNDIRMPPRNWYTGWEDIDWHFLPDTPEELIRQKQFSPDLHYMSTVTRDEAAYLIYNNKSLLPNFEVSQQFFDLKIREFVHKYNYTLNPEGVYQAIKYMYTYWPDPTNTTHIREQYINFMSDFLYKSPHDKMTKMMVDAGVPTYAYVLNTTIRALNYPFWTQVPHNIDYHFITGGPFMDPEFYPEDIRIERKQWTEEDRKMSEFVMTAFAKFAKFGRPTPVAIYKINWQEMRPGDLRYLNLNNTDNSTMMWNYRQQECAFWSEYMPTVVGYMVPTYRPTVEYWWEPSTPVSVAFWSISGVCLLLLMLVILCCCMWRGAKKANRKLLAENYLGDGFAAENVHAKEMDKFKPHKNQKHYTPDKLKLSNNDVSSTTV